MFEKVIMCGIAGFVGGFVDGLMDRMNAVQAHRGPDGRGVFEDAGAEAALGHVRLAILDLSGQAAQPMTSADGRHVLVFNGEIYNFRELRVGLERAGCAFRSTGDTEVLLHGLALHGESFVDRLNGMFAFALWDARERKLLLARDQLGIKPLYHAQPQPGTLVFASEAKALFAHPALKREADFEVLQQHLAYCHASGSRTALRGVQRLEPGALLRWSASAPAPSIRRYWRPCYDSAPPQDRRQAAEELRELLRTATESQLVSDVAVGAFLSGGLDSSLITAFARAGAGTDFQCYTITYPPEDNRLDGADDDAPHARSVARSLGLHLEEIEIRPELASLWPRLIHHLDEPIADPAAISCYLICRLARSRGTPVLLSGQGSDELFCGYPRYPAMQATRWFNRVPRGPRRLLAGAAGLLPGSREGRVGVTVRRVRRVLTALGDDPDERFLSYCAATPEAEIAGVLSPEFRAALEGRRFKDACLEHLSGQRIAGLERLQDRDLSVYLPNHNLLYTDKMGMAVGLEARVPFLDMKLVEHATRYPAGWKLAGGQTKAILREAARGVVPDAIIDRRKAGFGAPYRKWLRHDLAPLWNDLLSDAAVRRRGWFDPAALARARQRSQEGEVDLYMLQWAVLSVELWARQFLDCNPAAA
jgi:asparagine synthase (glutamine-hydrolysing)